VKGKQGGSSSIETKYEDFGIMKIRPITEPIVKFLRSGN
jgi:hypothetical protein